MVFKEHYAQPSQLLFHPVRNNRTKNLNKPNSTTHLFRVAKEIGAKIFPGKKIHPHPE